MNILTLLYSSCQIPTGWEVNTQKVTFTLRYHCEGSMLRNPFALRRKNAKTNKQTNNTSFLLWGVTLPFSTFPLGWDLGEVGVILWQVQNMSLMIKIVWKWGLVIKTGFPISWSWMGEPWSSCLTKPECEAQIVSLFIIKMCSAHIKPTSHTLRCHISSTLKRLMFC